MINSDGALQEWGWPGLKDNYIHRHLSQLLPVWPYREITPESTPELFRAASVVLAKKDGYHETAGHGILHGALIAAGLKNGASVNKRLLQLTKDDYYYVSLCSSHNDRHGVFCTDTCNTVPAIMMEMLVSSDPAIVGISSGASRGVSAGEYFRMRKKLEGAGWDGEEFEMGHGSKTVDAVIQSDINQNIRLIERTGILKVKSNAPVSTSLMGSIARVIELKAGESVSIHLDLEKN